MPKRNCFAWRSNAARLVRALFGREAGIDGPLPGPGAAPELDSALLDFRAEADRILAELRAKADEFQQTHAKAIEGLRYIEEETEEQKSNANSHVERSEQQLRDQQAKFNTEQQERGRQFNESMRAEAERCSAFAQEAQRQLEGALEEEKRQHAELRQSSEDLTKQYLAEMQQHLMHAKRIVGLIGNTGMAGHYQKVANRELYSAELLRVVAVLFFGTTAWLVWQVVSQIQATNYNWEVALFRLAVAAVLIAPAVYCARESTRHRRSENRNRQVELELASIHPFLETLPKEKAQAVIERKADQYFGQGLEPDEEGGTTLRDLRIRGDQMLKMLERVSRILNGGK